MLLAVGAASCSLFGSTDELAEGGTAGGPPGGRAGASGASGGNGPGGAPLGGTSGSSGASGKSGGGPFGGATSSGAAGSSGGAGAMSGGGLGGGMTGGAAGSGGLGASAGNAGASGADPAGSGGGVAGFGGAVAGAAGAAGAVQVPTGAIVIGGSIGADDDEEAHVLAVLDPATGAELSRETMTVAAVAYDGAPGRDLWYVFESLGFAEPAPGDELVLHTRMLDRATGKFTDVSTKKLPALVLGSVVVLTNHVAFLSYANGNGGNRSLSLIDTTNPALPLEVPSGAAPWAPADAQGLVGVRNATGTGGTLDVMGVTAGSCGMGGTCTVSIQALTVGANGVNVFPRKVAGTYSYTVGAQPTWTGSAKGSEVIVAFPGKGEVGPFLQRYSSAGVSKLGNAIPFGATGPTLRSMAYDECNDLAFLTELNADQAVFAVPLAGGGGAIQSLGKPAQRVLYEPASRSLVVPFAQGGEHFLRAFSVDAKGLAVKLNERSTSWKPPLDLSPGPMAFRAAYPTSCELGP